MYVDVIRIGQCRHHLVTAEEPGYQLEVSVEQIQMAGERRTSEHRAKQVGV